ncbi:MAG TPA: glycosyltransferase, partial [Leptospiraceae bacterium]|nr:glycosyltransferase [Leptospiraceae bacterium]
MNQVYDCIASVVVYDTSLDVLLECVNSFLDTKLRVKIYIIDNSAVKGNYPLPDDPRIYYHFNHGRNVGYGQGNNIAIENAEESKYFLILNPDVFIKEDALEKLIHFMDMNPEIGISIPKVLNLDGSQQFVNKRHPAILPLFIRRF